MSGGYEVVDEGHVGGQEQFPSAWKTIRTQFHDFADLPSERYDCTESPVLQCHGLEWQIQLYPGGDTESSEDDVFISLRLWCKSCTNTNKIKAKFNIRVPSAGRVVDGAFHKFFKKDVAWGFNEYAKREDVLKPSNNYLPDGNLTVEVDIQVMLDKPPVWTPTNTISADMLAFLDAADALNTDVTFEVASEDAKECVYAHGQILAARCPTLASLAEGCDPDTPIPIGDVQADVFRMLLRFIYAGEVPSKKVIHEQAKDIIRVADRFGCTGLKLTAEAELATAGITTENAAELILFADGTNCALLKETAMEFFVKNSQAVMKSDGFEQVKESPAIMAELMVVGFGGSTERPAPSDPDGERDYKRMRVSALRRKLDEKGFDVDGSKEMLISRLEAAEVAEAEARAQAEALIQAEAEAENEEEGE